MGSWGVRAHESDGGLDMLAVAVDRCLRAVNFKTFHVRHITELLNAYIVDKFVKESEGWDSEYIDFFYDNTYRRNFANAVKFIAECIEEYRCNGKYDIYDSKTDEYHQVTDFIITRKDLETLRSELQSTLEPDHILYDAWNQDSETLSEWLAHTQSLCEMLSQAITEGGGSDA